MIRFIISTLSFFTGLISAAQPLTIRVDSLTTMSSMSESREFEIRYTIENTSEKKISMILKPGSLQSNTSGSMSNGICYRLSNDVEVINAPELFIVYPCGMSIEVMNRQMDEAMRKAIAEIKTDSLHDETYLKSLKSTRIMKDYMSLMPGEKISKCFTMSWDKQRYHRNHDYEFYIDEAKSHHVELVIVLLKEELRHNLTADSMEKIASDTDFISGVFTSEKIKIDLSD